MGAELALGTVHARQLLGEVAQRVLAGILVGGGRLEQFQILGQGPIHTGGVEVEEIDEIHVDDKGIELQLIGQAIQLAAVGIRLQGGLVDLLELLVGVHILVDRIGPALLHGIADVAVRREAVDQVGQVADGGLGGQVIVALTFKADHFNLDVRIDLVEVFHIGGDVLHPLGQGADGELAAQAVFVAGRIFFASASAAAGHRKGDQRACKGRAEKPGYLFHVFAPPL